MPTDPPTDSDKTRKPAVPEVARGMGESNMIDPTPGWVPFVVVIGLGVVLIFAFVLAAILVP